jgi:hypothetical protein
MKKAAPVATAGNQSATDAAECGCNAGSDMLVGAGPSPEIALYCGRAVFVAHGDESFSFGQPCSLLGKVLATLPKFKYIDLID